MICTLIIDPKIKEEPHFESVRLRRTHSKCELLLNFQINTKDYPICNPTTW
jgi:hypothetical protein